MLLIYVIDDALVSSTKARCVFVVKTLVMLLELDLLFTSARYEFLDAGGLRAVHPSERHEGCDAV